MNKEEIEKLLEGHKNKVVNITIKSANEEPKNLQKVIYKEV